MIMGRLSVPLLLLVISVAVHGLPWWSKRSFDHKNRAGTRLAYESAPAPTPLAYFEDNPELRPPLIPSRVQRQEGLSQRPTTEPYITDQSLTPLTTAKTTELKLKRCRSFFYNHNPTSYQLNSQPKLRIASRIPGGILQPARQLSTSLGQQENTSERPLLAIFHHQQLQSFQHTQHQQELKQQPQQLMENWEMEQPHKQIKFKSLQQEQFPRNKFPTSQEFQSPQLQLVPQSQDTFNGIPLNQSSEGSETDKKHSEETVTSAFVSSEKPTISLPKSIYVYVLSKDISGKIFDTTRSLNPLPPTTTTDETTTSLQVNTVGPERRAANIASVKTQARIRKSTEPTTAETTSTELSNSCFNKRLFLSMMKGKSFNTQQEISRNRSAAVSRKSKQHFNDIQHKEQKFEFSRLADSYRQQVRGPSGSAYRRNNLILM